MKVFSLKDIPVFSQKERIVVVGVIGKSPYRYPNKTTPLLSTVECSENGIECYWDERCSILYLHTITYFDTKQLEKVTENLNENSKTTEKDADPTNWLVAAGELAAESCRIIALLFHLCHIVVLSSPTPVFDLGFLQIFKAVDNFRTELVPRTSAALASLGIGGVWESHGRSCCPRLLFHFRRAPRQLKRAPAALKRLEHSVEDQLYLILRKARIITNVCAKSLFAIPKNEEFVFMSCDEDMASARDLSALVRGLVLQCAGVTALAAPPERPSFRQFLQGHVDLAFGEGFDDNVGKYAMSTCFFELPSASVWREVARVLMPLYYESEVAEGGTALFDTLATDVRFSQARCAKVLPIAQASYAEGLPPHYSSQHHAHKVTVALGVLESMARGPLLGAARAKLRGACDATWRTRTLCEVPSLTHHPCIEPQHDSSKEHSSGVRYVSACNCGRSKCSREDPYSVRKANHGFYVAAGEECGVCPTLQSITFSVFQPSTPTYKAASVKDTSSQDATEVVQARGSAGNSVASREGSQVEDTAWSAPDALSPGSARDEEDEDKSVNEEDGFELLAVRGNTNTEKAISRQPSTTEYLPGMVHTGSPLGLLPPFSSWSLVCLGASSLYSHNLGLPEHLQPGFLPHTNYLLPWDCAVRLEQANIWRVAQPLTRGRVKPTTPHQLTVKIFIGFEYECPRGHRFMMSSPDSVVGASGAGSGVGSSAGARLSASDMPLYAPCLCRGSSAMLAQLMRIHIVTPKAQVHVTLDPKVQPVAGGPIFTPEPSGNSPLKLSASAYWVLRLPYVYCSERGCLPRPRPTLPLAQPLTNPGKLIAPMFGLQD